MGNVEDLRRILQDFLAPEMRELKARMGAVDESIKTLRSEFREAIGEMRSDSRDLRAEMKEGFARIETQIGLTARIEALERKSAEPSQQ